MFSFGYIGKNVIFVVYNSNNVNINTYMINLKIKIPKIKRNVVKTNNNINKRIFFIFLLIFFPPHYLVLYFIMCKKHAIIQIFSLYVFLCYLL